MNARRTIMFRNRLAAIALAIASIALYGTPAYADSSTAVVTEDFTGTTTQNAWFFLNGACLTASTSGSNNSPGTPNG